MYIDEQIAGLEAIPTTDATQFRSKSKVLDTLRKLKTLRSQFENGQPHEGKVVQLLLEVLGERPPERRAE
jgi:hypothetical protein